MVWRKLVCPYTLCVRDPKVRLCRRNYLWFVGLAIRAKIDEILVGNGVSKTYNIHINFSWVLRPRCKRHVGIDTNKNGLLQSLLATTGTSRIFE